MNNPKTIVVIGASRGIGKAIVQQLAAQEENTIIALARNTEALGKAFSTFPNVITGKLDLAKDVHQQLEILLKEVKAVDLLINNAGLLVNKPFPTLTHEDLTLSYQVNVISVMETVQAILPKMEKNGGHIVNISSMGGVQGTVKFPGLSAYSTSKAALCSFTELFAEEYKNSAIKMNCLALGAAQTEMLNEAFPGYQAPLSAEEMAVFIVNFSLTGHQWFNGKILPVSLSTP
jgi:NAD(P)-dependent dehydrogenase (short-subunit alcohol dehydrogenase family)